eukprot:TRINITY_DN12451_c0_g2_i4.p1 TRINITY_DN12451_c0_g2~~TRINITY_DN12451_c0_g2_i4.p1  ORF type:complete len:963 (+),score=229.57 TRINITY_DN12451_c0_g2_i4:124-3012(+)
MSDEQRRASKRQSAVRTREASFYTDFDDEALDETASGGVTYDILDYVNSDKFALATDIDELQSEDLTLQYALESGLRRPVRFTSCKPPGLIVPDANLFTVDDVRNKVGATRLVDVMDVRTQEGLVMELEDWVDYYQDDEKDELLNVISLEFSKSELDPIITTPAMVRTLDWVDTVWPSELKAQQREQSNATDKMKYPKVQNVWYHVLKGAKIFWLVEPTKANLALFEKWSRGNQEGVFFGDLCPDQCKVVHLQGGDTFMIPTGWIHGVYTPEDSLVFGGNFLHGLNMDGQLRISALERRLKVPLAYRFPFFEELMWYAAVRYKEALHALMSATTDTLPTSTVFQSRMPCSWELQGLHELVANLRVWLASPAHRSFIPSEIKHPRTVVEELALALKVVVAKYSELRSSKDELMVEMEVEEAVDEATLAKEAEKYGQIKMVRDALKEKHPAAADKELLALTKQEWMDMEPRSRMAFRDMFDNELIMQSAIQGNVSEKHKDKLLQTSKRRGKYEGKRWRSSKQHIHRAKALQTIRTARVRYQDEDDEVRERRVAAAKALLAGSGHIAKMDTSSLAYKQIHSFTIKAADQSTKRAPVKGSTGNVDALYSLPGLRPSSRVMTSKKPAPALTAKNASHQRVNADALVRQPVLPRPADKGRRLPGKHEHDTSHRVRDHRYQGSHKRSKGSWRKRYHEKRQRDDKQWQGRASRRLQDDHRHHDKQHDDRRGNRHYFHLPDTYSDRHYERQPDMLEDGRDSGSRSRMFDYPAENDYDDAMLAPLYSGNERRNGQIEYYSDIAERHFHLSHADEYAFDPTALEMGSDGSMEIQLDRMARSPSPPRDLASSPRFDAVDLFYDQDPLAQLERYEASQAAHGALNHAQRYNDRCFDHGMQGSVASYDDQSAMQHHPSAAAASYDPPYYGSSSELHVKHSRSGLIQAIDSRHDPSTLPPQSNATYDWAQLDSAWRH